MFCPQMVNTRFNGVHPIAIVNSSAKGFTARHHGQGRGRGRSRGRYLGRVKPWEWGTVWNCPKIRTFSSIMKR